MSSKVKKGGDAMADLLAALALLTFAGVVGLVIALYAASAALEAAHRAKKKDNKE